MKVYTVFLKIKCVAEDGPAAIDQVMRSLKAAHEGEEIECKAYAQIDYSQKFTIRSE